VCWGGVEKNQNQLLVSTSGETPLNKRKTKIENGFNLLGCSRGPERGSVGQDLTGDAGILLKKEKKN